MMTIRITMWLRPLAHKLSKVGESLFKKLDTILNDQEDQDGLENQLFTYATVVFPPPSALQPASSVRAKPLAARHYTV